MIACRPERRLAAILVADVAGYSRLIGRDEIGTLSRLKAHRRELIEPLIAERRGRIVNFPGDNVLCEFPSAVDAIEFAVAMQRTLVERERAVPEGERIRFRVGINAGEVILEGNDVYGDTVNVAARLERLAEPGGVCISGTVREEVHGRLPFAFEDLGERYLKNIDRPVRVYRFAAEQGATQDEHVPPERLSIAVLPFADLSGEPGQNCFGDGIAEDVTTALTRFRHLLVTACSSCFAFNMLDATEIGHRLGVRFLIQGSVRRASDRVRITTRLVDAMTGTQLWAEHYDRPPDNVFAVQDEVVAAIAATLAGRLEATGAERARCKPATELTASDCLLRGMKYLAGYDKDANAKAYGMFERAVGLDPNWGTARAYLALAIHVEEFLNRTYIGPSLTRALEFAGQAIELAGEDSRCHRILAEIAVAAEEFGCADFHSEQALALNPNDAHAAESRAYVLAYLGRHEEAIGWMRKAMRLDPFHPGWYWPTLGRMLYLAGRHEEAIRAFERYTAPRFFNLAYLAACHAKLGHTREAGRLAARTLDVKPDLLTSDWPAILPFRRGEDRRRLKEGLLAAGLPT